MTEPQQPNKTDWAKDTGQDQYGSWADLDLAGVIQRMRWIEPSSFLMGSPDNEEQRKDNERQYRVTLTQGYWLADTACTQELWLAVVGSNPSHFTKDPQNPVENISWEDSQQFCQRANALLVGFQLRMPTEAQWEYACRAGTTTPFHCGQQITTDQANYDGNYPDANGSKGKCRAYTIPVRSFAPNAWGLYQMHGNVWEWCQDWYGDYPTEAVIDPQGPSNGRDRVLRGGSWINLAQRLRCASRNHGMQVICNINGGLRLAVGQCLQVGKGTGKSQRKKTTEPFAKVAWNCPK